MPDPTGWKSARSVLESLIERMRVMPEETRQAQITADELLPLVYDELRRLAAHKMAGGDPGNALQPTALVHEAWLRAFQCSEVDALLQRL